MIIKLDHIAYSCNRNEMEHVLEMFSGYQMVFHETNLKNLPIKRGLMDSWAEDHDIVLLNRDGFLPVEMTAYDETVCGCEKYKIENNLITVFCNSIINSKMFYKALGFNEIGDNIMILRTLIGEVVTIRFESISVPLPNDHRTRLDSKGYCCLAFVTNNAEKEKRKLDKCGAETTEIMKLVINKKTLNIFFVYNECDDIVEFICPER